MKKIIYFDEGSASDLLDIENGGSMLVKLTTDEKGENQGTAGIGAKTKLLFSNLFFSAQANIESNLQTSFQDSEYLNKTITNTILSDTIDLLLDNKNKIAKEFRNYRIEIVKNSIAFIQTFSPYLDMVSNSDGFQVSDDFNINLTKINSTLKNSKGYYEVIATNKSKDVIFRFNNKAFRNNYGLQDLLNMDLVFYGIKVGKMDKAKLNFSDFIIDEESIVDMNDLKKSDVLDMYDIILAGVN